MLAYTNSFEMQHFISFCPICVWCDILLYRNIDDVDKTMDEINEQTENMKQIQEALSAPIGAAADFDEACFQVLVLNIHSMYFVNWEVWTIPPHFFRMNWKPNLKNWKELSWRNSFFSLLLLLLQLQSMYQQAGNQPALLLRRTKLRKMSLLHYRQRWHSKRSFTHCLKLIFYFANVILCFHQWSSDSLNFHGISFYWNLEIHTRAHNFY